MAARELRDPPGAFYYWNGERPRHASAPQLHGTAEIRLDSADRAEGYWITRSDAQPDLNVRTSGVYLRADAGDLAILNDGDADQRAALIAERLEEWRAHANS